jgi:hypothetical protein
MQRLVNEEELLEVVGLTSRQLKELRYRKVVPFIKIRRTLLYDPEKVLDALVAKFERRAL